MTPREIGEYVAARQEKYAQDFKQSAILLDGLATQIRRFLTFKKSEWITPKDLYPKVFGEKQTPQSANVSPERKQRIIANTWKSFLGVK